MKSQPKVLPGSGGSGGPSIFTAAPPFDSGEPLPPFAVLAFCLFSPRCHSRPEKNLWTASRVCSLTCSFPIHKTQWFFFFTKVPPARCSKKGFPVFSHQGIWRKSCFYMTLGYPEGAVSSQGPFGFLDPGSGHPSAWLLCCLVSWGDWCSGHPLGNSPQRNNTVCFKEASCRLWPGAEQPSPSPHSRSSLSVGRHQLNEHWASLCSSLSAGRASRSTEQKIL